MSHLAHNRFWPKCICSWMMEYTLVDGVYRWLERLISEDPDCMIDHSIPGNRDAIVDAPQQ